MILDREVKEVGEEKNRNDRRTEKEDQSKKHFPREKSKRTPESTRNRKQ